MKTNKRPSTRSVMKELKIAWEQDYDSNQTDHFKNSIDKDQSIQSLVDEYQELKKADRGITHGIITNVILFMVVVPYLLYNTADGLVQSIAAVLSMIWGLKWAFNFLVWEDGIKLIKSKLQAYAGIIWDHYEHELEAQELMKSQHKGKL